MMEEWRDGMMENREHVILSLEKIDAGYYKREVLRNVGMEIRRNEIVLLIGPNGAGKSTVLKVISGILNPWKGKVIFEGRELDGLSAAKRARMGIGYFLQGGEVFPNLTIAENLEIAGMSMDKKKLKNRVDTLFQLFPKLKEIIKRRAGLLSGGERHQVALGMLFVREPKLMLLDEPSAGLSPLLVKELLESIKRMKEILGASVLVVEQNVKEGLKIAERVYLMKAGCIVKEIMPEEVAKGELLEKLFFE
jgi:branched-chain amino acid transport system ATP-binding protein